MPRPRHAFARPADADADHRLALAPRPAGISTQSSSGQLASASRWKRITSRALSIGQIEVPAEDDRIHAVQRGTRWRSRRRNCRRRRAVPKEVRRSASSRRAHEVAVRRDDVEGEAHCRRPARSVGRGGRIRRPASGPRRPCARRCPRLSRGRAPRIRGRGGRAASPPPRKRAATPGSTRTPCICCRSITSPPSQVDLPEMLWPPARTAVSSRARARSRRRGVRPRCPCSRRSGRACGRTCRSTRASRVVAGMTLQQQVAAQAGGEVLDGRAAQDAGPCRRGISPRRRRRP